MLELSELQLPTLSRGTDVAVYTHVTSDHLDRHGNVEAYRAVKRRLLELLGPAAALVLNDDDPVVGGYRAPAAGRSTVRYSRSAPRAGGLGVADGWIVAREVPRLAVAGGGLAETADGGRILPLTEIPLPGEHSVSNVLAAAAVGLLHGIAPDAIRGAVRAFPGVEHRLELVASVVRRALRERFPGHPAGRGDRRPARLPARRSCSSPAVAPRACPSTSWRAW